MSFKKNNPGCPCDCGGGGGPCGCASTQVQIDVSNADDIISIQGVRFEGGPCDYLDFEGFSAINGTYFVDWPEGGGEVELGRWGSTNGPLSDALGTKYCVYARLYLTVPTADPACDGFLCLCIYIETLFDGTVCPDVEDVTFTSCFGLSCGSFAETNDFEISLCVADDKIIDQPTTDDLDCDIKYYHWEVASTPV